MKTNEPRMCCIAGCERVYYARNLCRNHYERQRITGSAALQKDGRLQHAAELLRANILTVQDLATRLKVSKPTAAKVLLELNAQAFFAEATSSSGAGVRASFYTMQRKDVMKCWRLIRDALMQHGDLSAKELKSITGMGLVTVRRHLELLRNMGHMHVARRTPVGRKYEKLWRFGPGEDAPMPRPMTLAERNDKRKLREKIDPDLRERTREIQRAYHQRKNTKARRDPLVAAFFGAA